MQLCLFNLSVISFEGTSPSVLRGRALSNSVMVPTGEAGHLQQLTSHLAARRMPLAVVF